MVLSILRAHYGASGKSSLVHVTTDPRLHSYSFIAIKINCVNPVATTGYLLYSLAGRISSQLYRSCIYPSKGEYSSLVPNFIVNTQGPTLGLGQNCTTPGETQGGMAGTIPSSAAQCIGVSRKHFPLQGAVYCC